ncbi:MAG: hypothetical protein GC134_03205 [Proteobacteria bacterium]|nr:hypothetical protein [Pseudomonadota bacterium]
MRLLKVCALFAALSALTACAFSPAPFTPTHVRAETCTPDTEVADSVVVLGDADDFTATGFFVRPGILVTNAHVADAHFARYGANKMRIRTAETINVADLTPQTVIPLYHSVKKDLAIVLVPSMQAHPNLNWDYLMRRGGKSHPGEAAFLYGNPNGALWQHIPVLLGRVETHRDIRIPGFAPFSQMRLTHKAVDATPLFGASGAPIVTCDGAFVGMHAGSGGTVGSAVPASVIEDALFRATVQLPAASVPWPPLQPITE